MKTLNTMPRISNVIALVAAVIVSGANVLYAQTPALTVERDPSGVKLTWNAEDSFDFVLEGSPDLTAWTQVIQSVVKEGEVHRVFVPIDEAQDFYRLNNDGDRTQSAYVGSTRCRDCHAPEYAEFIDGGHGFKLVKVDGAPPTYFSDDQEHVPTPPVGWTWDDVSWVIGGALWKARFVDNDGYIVTGTNVQYNLATDGWVGYHADEAIGTEATAAKPL